MPDESLTSDIAPLTRKTTKGPLDDDEGPLAASSSSQLSPPLSSSAASPLSRSTEFEVGESDPLSAANTERTTAGSKDFTFLLDTSIYHPLGQIDIPQPFRQPFPGLASIGSSLQDTFTQLDSLLSQCQFLGAAHLAGLALTSGHVTPTDIQSISRLLSIRYSSLELSGNVLLAAQEAKALEDLASAFYYYDETLPENNTGLPEDQRPVPKHILPFDLRLQAVRLQSIGFSDLRRGISALYDLGLECRENLASNILKEHEFHVWSDRLEEIGFRVVNALIEIGDLDCATRTLRSMKPRESAKLGLWTSKLILLLLKMGDISQAEAILRTSDISASDKAQLQSLILVADGRYADAAELLSSRLEQDVDPEVHVLLRQNLATAYLYTGQIEKCRVILEQLVDDRHGYPVLISNLATLYELSSDRARDLKVGLTNRVAAHQTRSTRPNFVNADFRL